MMRELNVRRRITGAGVVASLMASLGLILAFGTYAAPGDVDEDGVPDSLDNCLTLSNPLQCDTNSDGYGNLCDGDFDNNGMVGASDLAIFRYEFSTGTPINPDVDMTCDGFLSGEDAVRFRQSFLEPPGPSGLTCAGTIPCP